MKKLKNIVKYYRFDNQDISALLSIVDTTMTITIGLGFAWVGVAVGAIGLFNDITKHKKINKYAIDLSKVVVNLYLVWCSYQMGV